MSELIDNATIAQIKDLALRTRILAQGAVHGHHNSALRGVGIEFNQFRAYEPGDELSKIDWKLFARSDRYYVREAEQESALNVWSIIDTSESMREKSQQGQWHKLAFAQTLVASIGYLANQQGDAIGLLGINSENLEYLQAGTGQRHYHQYLLTVDNLAAQHQFTHWEAFIPYVIRARQHSLVVLVSDFYQTQEEILGLIESLSSTHCQVLAIQLETNDEVNFNYSGEIEFLERETQRKQKVSADAIREVYLANRKAFNHQLGVSLAKTDVHRLRVNIDEPIVSAVRQMSSLLGNARRMR